MNSTNPGDFEGKFVAAVSLTTGATHTLAPVDTVEEAQTKLNEFLVLLGNPQTNFITISQVVVFKSALLDQINSYLNED